MDLKVKNGLLAIECSYPLEKDLEELPGSWLTSNKLPRDPSVFDEDDFVTVPSCWDGEPEFMLATNTDTQEQDKINQFGDYFLQNQQATTFMVRALGLITLGTALFKTFNNIKEKAISATTL
eukprot:2311401-Ditylum_brightwellii.AAC.1